MMQPGMPMGYPQQPMMNGMMMQNPAYSQGMPIMSNGMPQPPMPQTATPQQPMPGMMQAPMGYPPMMPPQVTHSGIPNNFGAQQPMMMQPGMMQPGMPMGYPPQPMGFPQQQMGYPQQQMMPGMPGPTGFTMQQNQPFTFVK